MESESKKRPLEEQEHFNETVGEPDSKKSRVDSGIHESDPDPRASPLIKKRTLKVIPPKDPGHEELPKEVFTVTVTENAQQTELGNPKSTLSSPTRKPPNSPRKSPQRARSEEPRTSSPKKSPARLPRKGSPLKEYTGAEPSKEDIEKQEAIKRLEEAKKSSEFVLVQKTLKKMELLRKADAVLDEIVSWKLEKKSQSIIVNDARLLRSEHPNYDSYLGHVVYTGAQSRAAHSNRAVDLELFLFPVFTEKHHYATIQVRIPAEFLTYRGNIAVRKSALWGTDVYTDDSDVVASIFC
jgi:hypothetical protein